MAVHYLPESPDNQSLRELRDEVRDLSSSLKKAIVSTDKFSTAFIALAIVQIAIGLWQFVFVAQQAENQWLSIIAILTLCILIVRIVKAFDTSDKK